MKIKRLLYRIAVVVIPYIVYLIFIDMITPPDNMFPEANKQLFMIIAAYLLVFASLTFGIMYLIYRRFGKLILIIPIITGITLVFSYAGEDLINDSSTFYYYLQFPAFATSLVYSVAFFLENKIGFIKNEKNVQ